MNIKKAKNSQISFGMLPANRKAIRFILRAADKKEKLSAIKSLDMSDKDKNLLKFFYNMFNSDKTNNLEFNALLDKFQELEKYPKKISKYFTNITRNWNKHFMSVRQKASMILDKAGIKHPEICGLSRSEMGRYKIQVQRNIKSAVKFLSKECKKETCPDENVLVNLHRILTKKIPLILSDGRKVKPKSYSGIIRGSKNDLIGQISNEEKTEQRLKEFFIKLEKDYKTKDIFRVAAKAYKELLSIVPFHDANGRTSRAFIDNLLLSKGQLMKSHPSNYAEVRSMPTQELADLIKTHCSSK